MLIVLLVAGCTFYEEVFEDTVDASNIWVTDIRSDRGDISYYGDPNSAQITVTGTSFARAGREGRARERESGTQYNFVTVADTLMGTVSTGHRRAGVDLTLSGPSLMGLVLDTQRGQLVLDRTEGSILGTADTIFGTRLVGDFDLLATRGNLDVDIWPFEDGRITLEANDGLTLALPPGLAYNIEVFADPDHGVDVIDLGFDTLFLSESYVSAQAGSATIQIDVFVNNGRFRLRETDQISPGL